MNNSQINRIFCIKNEYQLLFFRQEFSSILCFIYFEDSRSHSSKPGNEIPAKEVSSICEYGATSKPQCYYTAWKLATESYAEDKDNCKA